MDSRILQVVLTLAVVGSLAMVAGSIVTSQNSDWEGNELAGWRMSQAQRKAEHVPPPGGMEQPAPDPNVPPLVPPPAP